MKRKCKTCKYEDVKDGMEGWDLGRCDSPKHRYNFTSTEYTEHCKGKNWVGKTEELRYAGRPWWQKLITD